MKLMYGLVAVLLLCVGGNELNAMGQRVGVPPYNPTECAFAGILTGLAARGTSYALKEQGNATDNAAIFGAAFATTLLTLAMHMGEKGSPRGMLCQVSAAFCTYVATMYMVRTVDAPAVTAQKK